MSARAIYRTCAVALLVAIGAQRLATSHRPDEVTTYHAHIRDAVEKVPRQIQGWLADDVPVPTQAVALLDPNAVISRRYRNVENGLAATVLFVHCSDAHDMAGHFPLRCYPASGWRVGGSGPRDWAVNGLLVTGTQYEFYRREGMIPGDAGRAIVVANALLRPDGQVLRDMDQMTASIVGAGGQSSGAAQIQVAIDASVPEGKRDEVFRTLIGGFRPVIDAVLATPGGAQQAGSSAARVGAGARAVAAGVP